MRHTFLRVALASSVASFAPIATGCADSTSSDDPVVEATVAALSAGDAEADSQSLGALAFVPGGALTAGERVARVRAYIGEHLTCAQATDTSDGLELTFTKDCEWNGRKWTGTVSISWTADGGSAVIEFEGVKVTGATISGSIDVTSLGDRHVAVDADMQKVRPDGTVVDGTWEGEYQWTDTSYTVVSSTQTLTIDGHTATRTVTGLVWDKDERVPSAGTVSFSGFRGRTWTLVYAEVDGSHTVTVTRPNGESRTFVVGGNGTSVEE